MRHGHKSSRKLFNGHKAAVAVDTDSQLITAVDILPGNAPDNTGALELVEQSEDNTGVEVEETIGDCAYGDGATRQAFTEAERTLITKVPGRPNKAHFAKEDFKIDLEAGTCTCPAGQVTGMTPWKKSHTDGHGGQQPSRRFEFNAAVCRACVLRPKYVASKKGRGRTVSLHPQEALLQQARALQHSEAFVEYKQHRQVSEHRLRLARLMQLGMRQARYFGRAKTLFQLLMAATVANLTLVATKLGMMGKVNQPGASFLAVFQQGFLIAITTHVLKFSAITISLPPWSSAKLCLAEEGFRPGF